MSKVIAIFGAGTGLGLSMAQRFGREGFRVALVARRAERLEKLVAQLASEGIEAAAFQADLTDPSSARGTVAAIRSTFGRIDVVEYGPVPAHQGFTAAKDLGAATLERMVPLFFVTPTEVAQAVLPEMIERGDGAFLVTHGASAAFPSPFFSGPGAVMAATRNWAHSLNGELKDTGVYVGTVAVAAAIARSENVPDAPEGGEDGLDGTGFTIVDPDDIADLYWQMYTTRDEIERVFPAFPGSDLH